MLIAESGEALEHEGAVGVDQTAGRDDLGGEVEHVEAARLVRDLEPDPAQPALVGAFDGVRDGDLVAGCAQFPGLSPPRKL
jgi:hypothetical protein